MKQATTTATTVHFSVPGVQDYLLPVSLNMDVTCRMISGNLHFYALNYISSFNTSLAKNVCCKNSFIVKLYFLKPNHVQKTSLTKGTRTLGMCACHILIFLAQSFTIEFSISHPQEIDRKNCLPQPLSSSFLALLFFITQVRHKNIWLVILI